MIKNKEFDVMVYGATPGGVASAVTAARLGRNVALVEYHHHIGGMSASGLGKSDVALIQSSHGKSVIGALFMEFGNRIYKYYQSQYEAGSEDLKLCRDGYYYEPSVAEKIFREMIDDTLKITLFTGHILDSVIVKYQTLKSINIRNNDNDTISKISGNIFIDASYEGDLYAMAGADYYTGREAQ
jgi:hypothetical protein